MTARLFGGGSGRELCQTAGATFGIDNTLTEAESCWVLGFSFWAPPEWAPFVYAMAYGRRTGQDLIGRSRVARTGQQFHSEQFGRAWARPKASVRYS